MYSMDKKDNFFDLIEKVIQKKSQISEEEIQKSLEDIFLVESKENKSSLVWLFSVIKHIQNQIKNIFEDEENIDFYRGNVEKKIDVKKMQLQRLFEWALLRHEDTQEGNEIDWDYSEKSLNEIKENSKKIAEEIQDVLSVAEDLFLWQEDREESRYFAKEKAKYLRGLIEAKKPIDESLKKMFNKFFQTLMESERNDWATSIDGKIPLYKLEMILYCWQFAWSVGTENRDFIIEGYRKYLKDSPEDQDIVIGLVKNIYQMQENPPQILYWEIIYGLIEKIDTKTLPSNFWGNFLKAFRKRLYVSSQLLELCAKKIKEHDVLWDEKTLKNAFLGLERMNNVPRVLIFELKDKLEKTLASWTEVVSLESFIIMLSGLKSITNLPLEVEDFFLKKIAEMENVSNKNFWKIAEYIWNRTNPTLNSIVTLAEFSTKTTWTISSNTMKNFFKCLQYRKKWDEKIHKKLLLEISKKLGEAEINNISELAEMVLYINNEHQLPPVIIDAFKKHFDVLLLKQNMNAIDYKNIIFWLLRISLHDKYVDIFLQSIVKDLREKWKMISTDSSQEKWAFLSLYRISQMYKFYKKDPLIMDPDFETTGELCLDEIKEIHKKEDIHERSKLDFAKKDIEDLGEIYQENFYLGAFECDIYSEEHKLNIEIDWVQHLFSGKKDSRRDQFLREKYGVETIRIQNHRLKNIKSILANYLLKKNNKSLYEDALKDFFKNKKNKQNETVRMIFTKMIQKKKLVQKGLVKLYERNGYHLDYVADTEIINMTQKDVLAFVDYIGQSGEKTQENLNILAQMMQETEKPISIFIIKCIIKMLELSDQTSQDLKKELQESVDGINFDSISWYAEMISTWEEIKKIPGFIITIIKNKIDELKKTQKMKLSDYANIILWLTFASKKSSEKAPEVLEYLLSVVKELREEWNSLAKTPEERKLFDEATRHYLKHRKELLIGKK